MPGSDTDDTAGEEPGASTGLTKVAFHRKRMEKVFGNSMLTGVSEAVYKSTPAGLLQVSFEIFIYLCMY